MEQRRLVRLSEVSSTPAEIAVCGSLVESGVESVYLFIYCFALGP